MLNKKQLVKSTALGVILAFTVNIVLMCVLSVIIMTAGLLPADITEYVMAILPGLGAFVGGFAATKLNKGAGLTVGAVTGLAVFIIITAAAMLKGGEFSLLSAVRGGACLLLGSLGGILAMRERHSAKI